MIKKLLTLIFLFALMPLWAQWVLQNSGTFNVFKDVYCVDANNVVVVGDGGSIMKTTDGGANWIEKTSGVTAGLQKVQFLNASTGFAVGENGTLIKTTDGGESWSVIATNETTQLYGISCVNENLFYICGENGLIKKTEDGGVTFTVQNTLTDQTIKNIQFVNATTGYAQSDKLLKTSDGGTSWASISDWVSAFHFVNENLGFIVQENVLYKTIDGGSNIVFSGSSGGYRITDVFALNENTLWEIENNETLCGCSNYCIIKNGLIETGTEAGTYDNIANCRIGGIGDGVKFESIYFANETTGYAVGWGGIYKNSTGTMLGLDEVGQKDAITIYPNPASDKIMVSFEKNPTQEFSVEMINTIGTKVLSKTYEAENTTKIDVSSLSKGVYFFTVNSEGKKLTQKVIIQ